MTLTIQLGPEAEARIAAKARNAGVDVSTFVERVLHVEAAREPLDIILKPVHEAFANSGMNEDQLGELLVKAKKEMRADRAGQKSI